MQLRNRVALITGGSQGIGKAIATAFAREGAMLFLVARSAGHLRRTAKELLPLSLRLHFMVADVSDPADVRRIVRRAESVLGPVEILVNCAGVLGPVGPTYKANRRDWCGTIAINLLGPFYCIKEVLPGMVERRRGKIINLAGGGATSPRQNFSAYATAKAALVRLTETVAREVEKSGVEINAIAPGAVNTRMLDQVLAAGDRAGGEFAKAQKQKRQGGVPPERAAELAVFLASDHSNGLTGRLISAVYDDWASIPQRLKEIQTTDLYTLRRIDEKMAALLYPSPNLKHSAPQ